MRSENEAVVARRWPGLRAWLRGEGLRVPPRVELVRGAPVPTLVVDGIQLAGSVEPEREALQQARLVPPDAPNATVYGLAQGHLPRVLLARPSLESLRVVVVGVRAAAASLAAFDHSGWLGDARVELVRPGPELPLEVPFAVAPGDLRLADDGALALRDRALLELATPFIRRGLSDRAGERTGNLRANAELVRTDADVSRLEGAFAGRTVRVAAAGPTLSDHYGRLREVPAPLLCVDAALKPLLDAGVVPDVVVTIDSLRHGMEAVFDVPPDRLGTATLVYFPVVPHSVLAAWPGRRLLALGAGPPYGELVATRPGAVLWSSGSVTHPAVHLAVRTGARCVELLGTDFATPRGRSHVDGSAWQRRLERDVDDGAGAREGLAPCVLDGHGRRIPSQSNLIGYLRDLERFLARHPGVEFVNASRDGARIAGTSYREREHAA